MNVLTALQDSFRHTSVDNSRWLSWIRPVESPRLRLFCFPHAGSGASVYQKWADSIANGVEVFAIQPPGRETRIKEPLVRDLSLIVTELRQALQPLLGMPCVFFGHSVGAIVAFELARELRKTGSLAGLRALFVAGASAPHRRQNKEITHDLPREQFIAALRRLNGTPEAVLEHPELLDVVVPILRNDFFISETYRYTEMPPLDIPIVAFGGEADKEVTSEQLVGWKDQTTVRPFSCTLFAGDHFFTHSNREQLLAAVNKALREVVTPEFVSRTVKPAGALP
jgi:medium-chain acyl-[acyl-carrier-protein] hydrolase